jgi:hypothetical protein
VGRGVTRVGVAGSVENGVEALVLLVHTLCFQTSNYG